MKRVLHQTPPWAVVPVSILGASLLLALAHYVLDSETPPVAKHRSATAQCGPTPQLLPRMDCDPAGSAKASDVFTTSEGANSQQCLASSDAVSVLAPVDVNGRVNTEWHPMNSTGAIPTRPVALLPTDSYMPQARMAKPSPRYGANVSESEEMPLTVPANEIPQPVKSCPHGLINSLFLPPGLSPAPPQLEPVLPLSPVESSSPRQDEVATTESLELPTEEENGTASPGLLPLPPIELPLSEPFTLPDAEILVPPEKTPHAMTEDLLVPLPHVESSLLGQYEVPTIAAPEGPAQSVQEIPDTGLVPFPPVESSLVNLDDVPMLTAPEGPAQSVQEISDAVLEPFPPVEPKLLAPQDSLALRMIEGLFKRVDGHSEANPEREGDDGSDPPDDRPEVQESNGQQVAADGDEQTPQPLPPVVRDTDGQADVESTTAGKCFSPRNYERTWELELIAREADKHTHRAFQLANKKAYFSARLEFTRALRIIAQGLDTQRKTSRYSRALADGLRALVEAEEFLPKDGHLEAELDLAVIGGAHRTPVFRDDDMTEMTPLAAIQKYHMFAQQKLADAIGKEVAGSMALYGLGKLYIAISNQHRGDGVPAARPKAMLLLQAALIADPTNHMASNELGVLLARNSRHAEARAAFEHSVAAHPTAEAWRNLALTYEQLGEMDAAYQAAQKTLALRSKSKGKTSSTAMTQGGIRWVSPAELSNAGGNVRTASAPSGNGRTR